MSKVPHRLVVIGHGAAGLTAAVAAAEAARSHDLAVEITLLEKAPQEAAGGNTLWSPSYMRLDASDRIAPDFEDAMWEACDGRGDRLYFRTLAENATTTVAWLERHGVAFCAPLYYLSAGPRRIQPVGGGRALVGALSRAARGLGVAMRYGCPAERIVMAGNGRVGGIVVSDADGTRTIPADAVILASGGFQADGEMMRAHFGPGAEDFKLISPGTRHNSGDAAHRTMLGSAPRVGLLTVRAFSSTANSAQGTTFNILRGLDWAADQGARVVNMSFAGPSDPALHDALVKANKKGMVLIAAAGNAGPNSPPLYPGADPNVIAVTATDSRDALFPGANRGNYIAVAAPGVDVFAPAPEGTYQLTTGTSVAAAEVSGVAALLIERNPALTPAAVRKILMDTAFHLGPKGRNRDFGTGLVNALDAVNAAKPK